MSAVIWMAFLAGISQAAGPMGPAVVVKQVAPPDQLVSNVKTLQIAPFKGTDVDIVSQVKASLADGERLKTDNAAIAKEAVGMAADIGSQYLGGLVGGGIQGKLVSGLTKNTVEYAAEALEADPLILDSGLTINVFEVVEAQADATLTGMVNISDRVEDYTTKEAATDSNGNVQVDSEGNTIMVEIPCRRRMVDVTVEWSIRGTGNATGTIDRKGGDARCGAAMSDLLDANTIATPLLSGLGDPIVRDMAPAWRVRRLAMNKTKVAKEAFKSVRQSDWDAARCAFQVAADANPEDSDALFDHGVTLEAFGHHEAARARYAQAIAIKEKNVYTKASERLDKRVGEIEAMTAAYGLTWKIPAEPPACN